MQKKPPRRWPRGRINVYKHNPQEIEKLPSANERSKTKNREERLSPSWENQKTQDRAEPSVLFGTGTREPFPNKKDSIPRLGGGVK